MTRLYAIMSMDKKGAKEGRTATRPKHKEYVQTIAHRIHDAGAILDADGNVISTMLIISAESQQEAEEIAGRDPYVAADIFANRTVGPLRMSHRDGKALT